MSTTVHSTAIGVFADRVKAFKAIGELHLAGFEDNQIGFVGRNGDPATLETTINSAKTESAVAGVVGGGVIGGALGAAVALLIPGFGPAIAGGILGATLGGAALGATAGGFIGALEGMGVPQEDARYYQDQLEAGSTIVTVQAGPRYQEALDILRRYGSYDATDRLSGAFAILCGCGGQRSPFAAHTSTQKTSREAPEALRSPETSKPEEL
jgi:hypothetical protein